MLNKFEDYELILLVLHSIRLIFNFVFFTISFYCTAALTVKFGVAFADSLYLKINCLESLVTFSALKDGKILVDIKSCTYKPIAGP